MSDKALNSLLQHRVVRSVAEAFSVPGAEIALVGGVVRDALCGEVSDDLDFTTNLRPSEFRPLIAKFGHVWDAGARFGTLAFQLHGEKVEVTTYRTETYLPESRKPEVGFGQNLEEDLARRDLTMNAMALRLHWADSKVTGELVDPFGGAKDLAENVLRTPSEPNKIIRDDPLRALRAVRFAAKRTMALDPLLEEAITSNAERMSIVARERKLAELEKVISAPRTAAAALSHAFNLRVEKELFGDLANPAAGPFLNLLEGGRMEVLTLLGDLSSDVSTSMQSLRFANADTRKVRTLVTLLRSLRQVSELQDLRPLVRTHPGSDFDTAFKVMDALNENTSKLKELLKVAEKESLRTPLPVDGNDALEAGLVGKDIREALNRVEERLFQTGKITREEALLMLKK